MTKFTDLTLAVTGASGHLGGRTLELLHEAGAKKLVAITRNPEKLTAAAREGVEVRQASFDEPASLAAAFAGVDRLLIVSTDALETRTFQQVAAIAAAEAAGVKHVAYTGLTSPYPDPTNLVADSHFWTEARLAASTRLTWSVLRNNQYTDYLIPGAQHAIATGTLFHAAGTGRRAYVTREDCAAAAAAVLLGAEGRRVFDIGGAEALSMDELAALFSDIAGKPIVARNVPPAQLKAGFVAGGLPEGMAEVLTRFDVDASRGYLGIVTDTVAQLTGRPAQSVASFLAGAKSALAA